MFVRIAEKYFGNNTQDIFLLHPEQLSRLIEAVWSGARTDINAPGTPLLSGERSSLRSLLKYRAADLLAGPDMGPVNRTVTDAYLAIGPEFGNLSNIDRIDWHHLSYAFMLENTRMVQIFHRVLFRFLHGEDLGTPSPQTVAWIRNTEFLFYRHLPGYQMMSVRSELRPDSEATRRNAYYRMLGMDLSHGTAEDKPYPYHKPGHSNRDFVSILEKLLYEIHQGLINRSNSAGVNTTDYATMTNLFQSLRNMLKLRRQGGNLAREEFNATVMMSWFHLTLLQENFSLIDDLGAKANSPEDRLIKIGKRVDMPANSKSGDFMELGEQLSKFLLEVEAGEYEVQANVKGLFDAINGDTDFQNMVTRILTLWSITTGRNIKAQAVRPALALR